MKILFVGEKPNASRQILEHMPANLQLKPVAVLNIIPYGTIRFNYPREIAIGAVPLLGDPRYKIGDFFNPGKAMFASFTNGVYEGATIPGNLLHPEGLAEFFQQFDAIVVGTDPDHTGQWAAQQWLRYGGVDFERDLRVTVLKSSDYTLVGIERAWAQREHAPAWSHEMRKYAEVKRYFEYNFNVNSLAVFGCVLRSVGVDTTDRVLTKYMLLLMHLMTKWHGQREGKLHGAMTKYEGSGKYSGRCDFGSPASRPALIENLVELGLLIRKGDLIEVSERGRQFMSKAHKKTFDPDLPFRIDEWARTGLSAAKPSMDRYLNTVFGKQKRSSASRPS